MTQAGSNDGNVVAPGNNFLGAFSNGYRTADNLIAMSPEVVSTVGGSQAHENRQPFLALNYCIALQGIFPSQN